MNKKLEELLGSTYEKYEKKSTVNNQINFLINNLINGMQLDKKNKKLAIKTLKQSMKFFKKNYLKLNGDEKLNPIEKLIDQLCETCRACVATQQMEFINDKLKSLQSFGIEIKINEDVLKSKMDDVFIFEEKDRGAITDVIKQVIDKTQNIDRLLEDIEYDTKEAEIENLLSKSSYTKVFNLFKKKMKEKDINDEIHDKISDNLALNDALNEL